jgi:hypothetical protein
MYATLAEQVYPLRVHDDAQIRAAAAKGFD